MFRSLVGYAVFAALVLFGLKLLGFVWGLLGTILWLAFLGFVFYLVVLTHRDLSRLRRG